MVEIGEIVAATGHTEVVDAAVAATCTGTGLTEGKHCSVCNTVLVEQTVVEAKDHTYDSGVITKEPTTTEKGIKTYTCIACGSTKTEEIACISGLKAPSVSLNVSKNTSTNRIVITGTVDDYANLNEYYEITAHGLLYINTSRIGSRVLTVNTSGRTRVNFSSYTSDGSFTYNLKPTSTSTSYTMRAFITYKNTVTGQSVTVYSDTVRGSYNTLK